MREAASTLMKHGQGPIHGVAAQLIMERPPVSPAYFADPTSGFTDNNAKEIRYEPRRVGNEIKIIKHILDFDINKYTCNDFNANKVKCEHCSSVGSFIGLKGQMKRVHSKVDLPKSGYFNKKPGCSCKCCFLFSKLEASGIDIDEQIEISKK